MKKFISVLAVVIFAINLSFASYSNNQTNEIQNSNQSVAISDLTNSTDFSTKLVDLKGNLKNFKTKTVNKFNKFKVKIKDKIENTNTSINKFIIIGLLAILLGVLVGVVFGSLGYLLGVVGVVLIILGLIQML